MTSPQNRPPQVWLAVAGVLSTMGVFLGGLASVAGIGLAVALGFQGDRDSAALVEWYAVGILTLAACGVPFVYWGVRSFISPNPIPVGRPSRRWAVIVLLFPAALLLGHAAFVGGALTFLIGPVAQILGAALPVVWVVLQARWLSPASSPLRVWGQFLAGLWATPLLAIVVEIFAIVAVGLLILSGLSFSGQGPDLIDRLAQLPDLSPAEGDRVIEQVLRFPTTIAVVGLYFLFLVPMIEEPLKTMAVWPVLGRRLTASEAFQAGVVGGAGFSLFESLLLPQPGGEWAATVVIRIGATLMHSFNAGLTSWALAEAFVRRRPMRLALALPLALATHGLWNAAALGFNVSALYGPIGVGAPGESALVAIGAVCMLLLGLTAAVGLVWVPGRLRRGEQGAAS